MKIIFRKASLIIIGVALFLSSCGKEEVVEKKQKSVKSNELTYQADEEAIQREENMLLDFAIEAFSVSTDANARLAAIDSTNSSKVCGAVVTRKKTSTHEEINLTFDGMVRCIDNDTCQREGVVQLELALTKGTSWSQKGAIITMTFHNYTISYGDKGCEERCLNLNGVRKIINVSGGLVETLPIGQSVVHEIHGQNMSLKFNSSADVSNWNASRRKTITRVSEDEVEFVLEGIGSYNGMSDVALYGTDRENNAFYIRFVTPLKYRTCPGKIKVLSGEKVRKGIRETKVVYGVSKTGELVNDCSAYGYRINWTSSSGEEKEVICKY